MKSDEQLARETIQELKEETGIKTNYNYEPNKINWLDEDFWDSWEKIKGHSKKTWEHKKEYVGDKPNWFFLAHSKDVISGKPQLIEAVQKRIPLVRLAVKKIQDKETEEDIELQSFYFFDEKFDKRHDGFQLDAFALDFWMYKIVDDAGKEYFILTQEKLPNCRCTFRGMSVELDDFAEMSRSMKIKSLSRLFFMRDYEADVKILDKEAIINFCKEREIDEDLWFSVLSEHENGCFNLLVDEVSYLRSAWILSGKMDGYPLHLAVMGRAGTKKSMGLLETTSHKFKDVSIFEGANGRIKGLIPSFKEKPANLGYIAKAERVAFIDEIGKMVEFEMNKHQSTSMNILGELNSLLDNKKRIVGSGNDNDLEIEATAKCFLATNPVSNKATIKAHVGLIDTTTMSRILWWVQDDEETSFALGSDSLIRNLPYTYTSLINIENRKKDIVLKKCWGEIIDNNQFLTLFDTCNSFTCDVDFEKVQAISKEVENNAQEPMKSSVWKPRCFHHVFLLIDGLCKHRCLFKDYDSTFEPKQEDYELAKKILMRMVKSWETNLSPKEDSW
jgi:hypothetical protein